MFNPPQNSLSLVASNPRNIKIGSLTLDIISTGGYYTCIQLPKHKIAIDMGICPQEAIRADHVFFTHPHVDHISAVIQHVSTREMISLKNPSYFIEDTHKDHFEAMIESWRKLSMSPLECTVIAIKPGEQQYISKTITVEAFRSVHRIPCLGYTFFTNKNTLLPEYQNKPSAEIVQAKKKGITVQEEVSIPILSVTGDTTHHVFRNNPRIFESEVIITEVTFFGDKISALEAQKRGHMHILDILPYEEQLLNTNLVIMHLSSRYKLEEVERIVNNTFSKELRERITLVSNTMVI